MKRTLLLVLPTVAALVLSTVVPATAKPKPPSDKGNAPGTIAFVGAPYTVAEGAASVTITIERFTSAGEATGKGRASVDVVTSAGTATAGGDYTPVSATLTFGKDETTASANVPILDDSTVEGDETFTVTLSNPVGRYSLPTPSTTVTITDDDTAVVGPITNGGFETGDFTGWYAGTFTYEEPSSVETLGSQYDPFGRSRTPSLMSGIAPQVLAVTPPTPVVQTSTVHSGDYAAYVGGPVEGTTPDGVSYLYQDVTVPDDGHSVLSFYFHPENTGAELGFAICNASAAEGNVNDCYAGTQLPSSPEVWQERQFDLGDYVGQAVRIVFLANQWGDEAGASMYLDDVTLLLAGPTNLYATPVPADEATYEIDLSWDPAADATGGYTVLRSAFTGGPYTPIDTTTAASYQDTSVAPATFYCYVVRSVTDDGETGNSNEACTEVLAETVFNGGFETGDFTGWTAGALTFDEGPGPGPTSLAVAAVDPPMPVVQNTTVHDGTYAAHLGGPVEGVTPEGLSYVYVDLAVPAEVGGVVSFYYRPQTVAVEALHVDICDAVPPIAGDIYDSCFNGGWLPYGTIDAWHQGLIDLSSSAGQAVRLVFGVDQIEGVSAQLYLDDVTLEAPMTLTVPDPPTNLAANADGAFQTSLSWDASTGATGYLVFRSEASGGPYDFVGETDVTSFQDRGLAPATTYYYVVRSVARFVTGGGEPSAESNEADVTTGSAVATVLDTLEADTSGWTTTGMVGDQTQSLWHLIDDSPCATPAYTSATHAFYYGIDDTCDYDTTSGEYSTSVRNSGTLTSPVYTIPETSEAVSFAYLLQTECGTDPFCSWDRATVEVSYDSGATWVPAGSPLLDTDGSWDRVYLPVAPSGTSLQVRFTFDTIDSVGNDYLGWMIDDLSVYTPAPAPILLNGDFEASGTFGDPGFGWSVRRPLPGLEPVPAIVTAALGGNAPHSPTHAVQLGGSYPDYGSARDSQIQQNITVPATGTTTLTWWYQMSCNPSASNDWAVALVYAVPEGFVPLTDFWPTASRCQSWWSTWTQLSGDLTPYAGQTIKVVFGLRQADFNYSTLWIDDVAVTNVPTS